MELFSYGNIEEITKTNQYYRRVLSTTLNMQLVVMSLLPQQEIGMEKHPYTTQFVRVEAGVGKAIVNGQEIDIGDGDFVMVYPDTWHNFINTSTTECLRLYTVYSPPEHERNELEYYKKME